MKCKWISSVVAASLVMQISASTLAQTSPQSPQPPSTPVTSLAQPIPPIQASSDNKKFTITVEAQRTAAKNQACTNTCWNFATASFMESEVVRLGGSLIELSEVFGVRYAYPLKADAYVRLHGNTTFWEGGNNHDSMEMLRQYGAVPKVNYSGLKEGETTLDHHELALTSKAFLDAVIKSGKPSASWRTAFNGILNAYIGKPPENFMWQAKLYTPITFRDQVLKINPRDYVEFTSFSNYPFYQAVRLEIPDNWSHNAQFMNVPIDDMERIMTNALSKGFSISWGGDTSEKGFNTTLGYAMLEDDAKEVTQQTRQVAFDNWTSTDDHSMHVVGLSKDEKGNSFFLTKNSYGKTSGPYDGHLHMSKNYIRMKTIYFLVHKDGIPADIRSKINIK